MIQDFIHTHTNPVANPRFTQMSVKETIPVVIMPISNAKTTLCFKLIYLFVIINGKSRSTLSFLSLWQVKHLPVKKEITGTIVQSGPHGFRICHSQRLSRGLLQQPMD